MRPFARKVETMRKSTGYIAAIALAMTIATGVKAADPKVAEGYLNEAKKALEKGDARSAVIQLKNAVQADPDSGVARFELGSVELRLGDYLSAEKELRAAIEHHYDRDKVAPQLADALLHLRKNQELLDQIPAGDRPAEIESRVRIARGYALLELHRLDDAKKSFEDALARAAKPAAAELGLARALAAAGKLPEAVAATQKAIDSDANLPDAWVLMSRLKRTEGDLAAARSDIDKALALNPNYLPGRLERASLLIATNDLQLASADLDAVFKANPNHPLAVYYRALIEAREKNFRAAETSLQSLKGFIDSYPPALYLLAAVNLSQNEMAQAEDNINRFLSHVPNDEAGTALLANLLLRRGNFPRAIEVLKTSLDAHPQSLRLMGLLSDAYTRNKQPAEAAAVLDRATATHPEDADLRTRIAAQRLRIGRPDEALADLETATELSPKSEQAGMLLVLTLLQTNKIDEALKAAEELRNRLPDDPVAENLLGAITLRKGDIANAKVHFQKALQLKPDFDPAAMNLAQLAVAERHFDDARAIYEGILKRKPVDLAALIGQADLSLSEGKGDDAVLWLEKARNGNPTALQPRLRLIDAYIRLKDPGKAAKIAEEVEKIAPDDPSAINSVGAAHLANNEITAAIATFQHLAAVAPNSGLAQLQLARAHYAAKDNESARADLERAVALSPKEVTVQQQFIRFAIETNSAPKELEYLKGLAAKQPSDPAIDLLAGDLLMATNDPTDAAAAYAKGLAKSQNNAAAVVKLAEATARFDQEKAVHTLSDWLAKYPDQAAVRFVLGGMLIAMKRYDDAIAEHEIIVKEQPDNAAAANNLAWLYQRKHDSRALPLAERAYKMAPNSADLADTLGWILVQQGQNDRGLDLLSKVAKVNGVPPEVKYHLAVALKNAGRVDDARQNLEQALKGNPSFDGVAEAKSLLKELSGG